MRFGRKMLAMIGLGLAASAGTAQAQWTETEPNDSCAQAQPLGSAAGMQLSATLAPRDVDFFSVQAAPGEALFLSVLAVSNDEGTLGDPYLAVLDSSCATLATADDDRGLDPYAEVSVPADGIIVFAVTGYGDGALVGNHAQQGSYRVDFAHLPAGPAGTLSARVLTPEGVPFAGPGRLIVLDCVDGAGICWFQDGVDLDGRDRYELSMDGWPPGQYLLSAEPYDTSVYLRTRSEPFALDPGEDVSQTLTLDVRPVTIDALTLCEGASYASPGSLCTASFTLQNRSDEPLAMDAWLSVIGEDLPGLIGETHFQTTGLRPAPERLTLAPGEARDMALQVRLPRSAEGGTVVSVRVQVSRRGDPFAMLASAPAGAFVISADGATLSVRDAQSVLLRERLERDKRSR